MSKKYKANKNVTHDGMAIKKGDEVPPEHKAHAALKAQGHLEEMSFGGEEVAPSGDGEQSDGEESGKRKGRR